MGKRRRNHSWIPIHSPEANSDMINFDVTTGEMSVVNDAPIKGQEKPEYVSLAQPENNSASKLHQQDTYFPILSHTDSTQTAVYPTESKPKMPKLMNGKNHAPNRHKGNLIQNILEHFSVGVYVFGFVFAPLLLTAGAMTILFFPPLWYV